MKDRKTLRGIGYWHSVDQPDYPDPGKFVDEQWSSEERNRILDYLTSGSEMPYAAAGVSWCRFRCGVHGLGALEYTDGIHLWPEGLAHYIEKHNVRLPQRTAESMLSSQYIVSVPSSFDIDWTWWKEQKGWNDTVATYNTPFDIGILSIVQVNGIVKMKQGDLLKKYLISSYGTKERLHAIGKILQGQETKIKGEFWDIQNFLLQLSSVGLKGEFQRLSYEEYRADEQKSTKSRH